MTDAGGAGGTQSLDAVTVRVRAANPSPMTLTGTNTYLLGAPASGQVAVVDPGPALSDHRAAIETAVAGAGARVAAVVVTHHHVDHAEAVSWAPAWDAPAFAFDRQRIPGTEPLADGAAVPLDGLEVTAFHLPGHTSDHLCLQVAETGVVLTGDHVLGEGTTVIAWPDGDLSQYLDSLQALKVLTPTALYPGHGEVIGDPATRIDQFAAHRAQRTDQIIAALGSGDDTVDDIVTRVYGDLDPRLRSAAGRSVTAHLVMLEREGRAFRSGERWHGA